MNKKTNQEILEIFRRKKITKEKEKLSTEKKLLTGSNQYLQDSCSDTEGGICDTDSFGSRLSGNGVTSELKHIKEEIDNDDEYFRMMANQTRVMRHLDGK
jgi:hypothetical protein